MSDETTTNPMDAELAARLYRQRIVLLGGELDQAGGIRLTTQLLMLAAEDPERDIAFWIDSPGGSVPAMLAIMDVMRAIPNDVATMAIGMAASAGQFLLTAGAPGKRTALPHARILLHQGSSGIGGTAMDIELQAEDLRYTRDTVLGLIAEHTGQPLERVAEDSLRDRWYTAEQSVEYGFIDRVVSDVADIYPAALATRMGPGFAADLAEHRIARPGERSGVLA